MLLTCVFGVASNIWLTQIQITDSKYIFCNNPCVTIDTMLNFDSNALYERDLNCLNSLQYTYGMTEVHIQSNDKRSPEMSLMGETIESITKDDVVKYWGKSPFYKRLLNSVKMFMVR